MATKDTPGTPDSKTSWDELRAPFQASAIGKLPRKNQKTGQVIQLDYVGHAAVTDRLLKVDPEWNWEPLAYGEQGAPLIVQHGSDAAMWIRLTVCGVTRVGVGTCAANAFELPKQLISDAIRNAAMRFGVALDLWSKEELHGPEAEVPPATPAQRQEPRPKPAPAPTPQVEPTPTPEPVSSFAQFWTDFSKASGFPKHVLLKQVRKTEEGGSVGDIDKLSPDHPAAVKVIEWAESTARQAVGA